MLLSQTSKYAIRAVMHLTDADSDEPQLCKDIARELEVSASFLAKILSDLVRHHLLVSFRGRGGGFSLARPAGGIKLLDVVEAAGSPLDEACVLGLPKCSEESPCPVHCEWRSIKTDIIHLLSAKSVQQIVDEAAGKRSATVF